MDRQSVTAGKVFQATDCMTV